MALEPVSIDAHGVSPPSGWRGRPRDRDGKRPLWIRHDRQPIRRVGRGADIMGGT